MLRIKKQKGGGGLLVKKGVDIRVPYGITIELQGQSISRDEIQSIILNYQKFYFYRTINVK